jgi:L-fuculose-phosphate aldolase
MNNELDLKNQIIEIGKRIWTRGYVASNDGNITVKINDEELLTTPHGVSKGFMDPDMIVKVDRLGKVIAGNPKYKPSSEIKMHLEIYNERPDIKSVVHSHPPYATSFAVAGIPLNKGVLPEAILVIGAVPLAKYGLPSTMEVADSIREFLKSSDVILLANHGALSMGVDLLDAYHKTETLEHTASIIWKAIQLGNVNVLSEYERDRLMGLRDKYNLQGKVALCDATPMDCAKYSSGESTQAGNGKIDERLIEEITDKIIASIANKLR